MQRVGSLCPSQIGHNNDLKVLVLFMLYFSFSELWIVLKIYVSVQIQVQGIMTIKIYGLSPLSFDAGILLGCVMGPILLVQGFHSCRW